MRLLLTCLMLFSVAIAAEEKPWRLYKAVAETQVEYRHNADKLLQVKAQTEVKATAGAFLHLLEDTANITNWAANTEKAELLGQPEAKTHLVHTYFSAMWPVSKRDMVTQSVWQQDASSGVLTMVVSDMGQHFPAVKGYVRMQQVQARWTLTPLPDGRMKIEYQGQADAAGKLPHFIGDKVALKSLFKTFLQLQQVLPMYPQSYPGLV
ncbi:MAG: hypothetical protein KKE30_17905 [Gammaproteobacteria bacterium]|nr:hypothetical protein [Gammaproteobacteria bacterium]MBU1553858.1 hypothetical protein [Gammaproteobacteria bacterium]MBU2070608.1 hypothetical protein [Gammaproteobacteria bacterium]MBU2181970.1 hypothetical protein [Gammaproteobacteria bacterium]MBU2207114.1 hypothetical protein [Gammaproteobacteria bacterium]